jgi:putative ABC transport system ATP-binding protein
MIQINKVTKTFPAEEIDYDIYALDEIDFSVKDGEFVTIIGPSGSGKSTLLFTIGGLMEPTFGNIILNDVDLYNLKATERARLRRERIGFVFQTFNLLTYLNCIENVALPAIMSGNSQADAFRNAEMILVRLGLKERLGHHPMKLSVGERQRVAIARSLINGPEVILADEPTGNLDPATADDVMNLFKELNREGQTIIMVTHDHNLAGQGKRTITLNDGELAMDNQLTGVAI